MSTRMLPGFRAGQRAVGAEEHFAHVPGKADDGEDDVALLGDCFGSRAQAAPLSSSGWALAFVRL